MKEAFIFILFLSVSSFAIAQEAVTQAPDANSVKEKTIRFQPSASSFDKQTSVLSIAFGFVDYNKQNYAMPDSTRYGSGSMSLPVYLRAERAMGKHISVAAGLAYDVFYYNYSKEGHGNNGTFYRPQNDKVRIISPSLEVYYHLNKFVHSPNWDVFIGAGARANYNKHTNYPIADNNTGTIKPDLSPLLKLGARYYLNLNAAFFGDIGYDKMSLISFGFSYRLYGRILSL